MNYWSIFKHVISQFFFVNKATIAKYTSAYIARNQVVACLFDTNYLVAFLISSSSYSNQP